MTLCILLHENIKTQTVSFPSILFEWRIYVGWKTSEIKASRKNRFMPPSEYKWNIVCNLRSYNI